MKRRVVLLPNPAAELKPGAYSQYLTVKKADAVQLGDLPGIDIKPLAALIILVLLFVLTP